MIVESKVNVDNVDYTVGIEYDSMTRSFEIIEGENSSSSISAHAIRDIKGTGFSYTMTFQPVPGYESEYDKLYDILSAPTEYHTITVPYGQGKIQFEAKIESGKDTFHGNYGGDNLWRDLEIEFKFMGPYRPLTGYYVLGTELYILDGATKNGNTIALSFGRVEETKLILE